MVYIYIYIYVCNAYAHAHCNTRNTGSRQFRVLVCVGLESESRAHTTASELCLVQLAKRSRRNGVLDWPAF